MDIQGVIDLFETRSGLGFDLTKEYGLVDKDMIIEQLKRGEAYEKIYNELEEDYRHLPFSVASSTLHSMRILKEKYFPKVIEKEYAMGIDFADGESITIKFTMEKTKDGKIIIKHCEGTPNEKAKTI